MKPDGNNRGRLCGRRIRLGRLLGRRMLMLLLFFVVAATTAAAGGAGEGGAGRSGGGRGNPAEGDSSGDRRITGGRNGYGGVVTVPVLNRIEGLHPLIDRAVENVVQQLLFNGLVALDETLEPVPELAES